jgi:hypothetical protein
VVGDPAIVVELLPAAAAQVVLDHVVAERGAQRRRAVQAIERLAKPCGLRQAGWKARRQSFAARDQATLRASWASSPATTSRASVTASNSVSISLLAMIRGGQKVIVSLTARRMTPRR